MAKQQSGRFWRVLVYTLFMGGFAVSVSKAIVERDSWGILSGTVLVLLAYSLWLELRTQGSRGGPWTRADSVNVTITAMYALLLIVNTTNGFRPAYERWAAALVAAGLLGLTAYFVGLRRRALRGAPNET